MKRTAAVLFVVILVLCDLTVYAEYANPPIRDNAGILTAEERADITERLEKIRDSYNFDLAIYTERVMDGHDAQSVADDIFDCNHYGSGNSKDGMILYISANPRRYHLSTHGSGMRIFNDNGLKYLEKQIRPCLAEDEYYTACKLYCMYADELLQMAESGKPYNKTQHSDGYVYGVIGLAMLLPLLLAVFMTKRRLMKMKTAVADDYAASYMKSGSMKLELSRDVFLFATVSKTPRPKSGSGGHVSSSGQSHGGRGGSY